MAPVNEYEQMERERERYEVVKGFYGSGSGIWASEALRFRGTRFFGFRVRGSRAKLRRKGFRVLGV